MIALIKVDVRSQHLKISTIYHYFTILQTESTQLLNNLPNTLYKLTVSLPEISNTIAG